MNIRLIFSAVIKKSMRVIKQRRIKLSVRLIHTSCIWPMQLQQKCAVWKNRKFPISAETQLSAAASRVKRSLCELTFN